MCIKGVDMVLQTMLQTTLQTILQTLQTMLQALQTILQTAKTSHYQELSSVKNDDDSAQ